jgi:hypothetical protein
MYALIVALAVKIDELRHCLRKCGSRVQAWLWDGRPCHSIIVRTKEKHKHSISLEDLVKKNFVRTLQAIKYLLAHYMINLCKQIVGKILSAYIISLY